MGHTFTASRLLPGASRRQIMIGATALMGLAGTTIAQTVDTAQTQPKTADDIAAKTDFDNHLTIPVMVNGKGPYHFVVDTGAEQSLLADNLATELGLTYGAPVELLGFTKQIPAHTVEVSELAYGTLSRKNLRLAVLPRALLRCDGYLGLDAISDSRVVFDFRHNNLRVESARHIEGSAFDAGASTRIRAYGSSGLLRVTNCVVDDIEAAAFIDTGAEMSVGNGALKAALMRRHGTATDLGIVNLSGVTGGEIPAHVSAISRIQLQSLVFTDCTLAIADVPSFNTWNLSKEPALLIGMDFLRQLAAISIDYRWKFIRFEVGLNAPPKPSPNVAIVARG